MNLRVLFRLLKIHRVLVKHGIDEFGRGTRFAGPLKLAFIASPTAWFQRKHTGTRGERLRLALEELGPVFMKFGQTLSTRRDLLPDDIADELARLQDRVPPFPSAVARQLIETALNKPIGELFAKFDEQPLAAATIAQVHAAQLRDGSDVVVKVVRPGIRALIDRDIEVLYALADLAVKYGRVDHKLKPIEVVREYEKTIIDELDLMREAANASQLAHNFQNSKILYAPAVHWDYCRTNVMVIERIRGVQISDLEELRRRKVNFKRLAECGVEIFFTQVFRHNFFHADMHPGNLFVLTETPDQPVYAAIDFGIVGTLDPRDQHYLAENFLAFFQHDFRRVAQLHIDSGWMPAGTRVDELESAVRTVCEPIFNKPLKDISFGQVLMRLFQAAQRFDIEIQPQLVLLQKTLLQIEGLGRQLYPELDLWQTAKPIMQEWMRARTHPRHVLRELRKQLPDIGEAIRHLPSLFQYTVMDTVDRQLYGKRTVSDLTVLRAELRVSARRRDQTIIAAALLFSGMLWCALVAEPIWPGVLCLAAAVGVLLRRRSID